MKVGYLSGTAMPSRAASALHAARMSQALGELGHDVRLLAMRNADQAGSLDAFFGLNHDFAVSLYRQLPMPRGGGYYFALRALLTALRDPRDVYYGRHPHALLALSYLGQPLAFEAHALPRGDRERALEKRLFARPGFRQLVCITKALAQDYAALLGAEMPPVRVLPDAADPMRDVLPVSPWPGRDGSLQVGYVGHLYDGKGMEIVSELPARMPDVDFHVVGGREVDISRWREKCAEPNLHFHGFVPYVALGGYYRHFDAVVLPLQSKVSIADNAAEIGRWTSPLKAFEYMAHGKPIVASDLPVLREVFESGVNALLVDARVLDPWVEALRRVARTGLGRQLGERAQADFDLHYSWQARARAVMEIFQ